MPVPQIAPPSAGRPAIVHIVDDDDAVRESLRFLLEACGLEVRTYASGAELLRTGSAAPDDGWLVLDYHMPGMTGVELLGRLRAGGVRLPAVVVTAAPDPAIMAAAAAAGAVGVLQKPLDDDALLALLGVSAGAST